jgi:hypothetical protein
MSLGAPALGGERDAGALHDMKTHWLPPADVATAPPRRPVAGASGLRSVAACGEWQPEGASKDVRDVTCVKCRQWARRANRGSPAQ